MRFKVRLQKEVNPIDNTYRDYPPQKESTKIGCNNEITFFLDNYKLYTHKSESNTGLTETGTYECRVYRRVRWLDEKKKKKYKDWKIKVIQMKEPKSMDYVVMHKLPCKLS